MKLFEQPEPYLRRKLQPKRAKRHSYKKDKILRNRAIRRELNRNFNIGKEILNRVLGWEY